MVKRILKKSKKKALSEEIIEDVKPPEAILDPEKEERRKFLLKLQEDCAREQIHSLSDIEFKLAELDRQ